MDNKYMKRTVIKNAKMTDLYIGDDEGIVELIASDIKTIHVMGWVRHAVLIIDDASDVGAITGSGKLRKMSQTEMMFSKEA